MIRSLFTASLFLAAPLLGTAQTPPPAEPVAGGEAVGAAFKNQTPEALSADPAFWSHAPGLDPDVMLPPAWAFGVLYGAYTDQAGALAKARRLIAADLPIDALWIDSAFWDLSGRGPDGYINFKGDTKAFPDVDAYWREMHTLGLRNGIWTWERLNNTEAHYAEFKAKGFFKEAIIGNDWHNAGAKAEAGMVDFDNPTAAARWTELMLPLVKRGLDFYKIDAYPTSGYIRTHYALSRQAPLSRGGRGFVFSHPRQTKDPELMKGYGAMWTSDCVTEWDLPPEPARFRSGGFVQQIRKYADPKEGFAYNLPFLANDTGGYWASKPQDPADRDELYQRWTQFSAFGPLMEVFSDRSNPGANEPLTFSPAAQENARRYTHLRMRLFPYLYTMAHLTRLESRRIVRGDGIHPTQFAFGDAFWVAPVHAPLARTWTVHLPPGRWINYWTGDAVEGGAAVEVPAALDTLPLFVRAGAIVPMRNYARTIELGSNEVLTLDTYPHGDSTFTLIEDDGLSLDYLKGKIARTRFHCVEQPDGGLRFKIGAVDGDYAGRPAERTYILKLHRRAAPASVTLNGEPLKPAWGALDTTNGWRRWTADGQVAPASAATADLLIRFRVPTTAAAEVVIQ